jgi:xanthine dehydrogenase accessory factor
VILVFTHDSKFDVPAVTAALETPAGYIGALGSRRTHEDRLRRLVEAGVSEEQLHARLMSPCGLDIGGRTPAETAVSVMGEIIAHRHARPGRPLAETSGAIHTEPRQDPVRV